MDDERGVVLDVAVTTGEVNDGDMIEAQVDAVQEIAVRGITTSRAMPAMPSARSMRGSNAAASIR